MKFSPLAISLAIITISFASNGQSAEKEELKEAVKGGSIISQSAINSQKKIDQLAGQIQDKFIQFKMISKEADGLKVFNIQMKRQIKSQIKELKRLDDAMDQVTIIERQITPLMLRMIDGLKEFVSLDVPFLEEERVKRIQRLRSMMDRADVTVSEKFRRVLEAYQVEVDYGRTIEAYSGNAVVEGKEQQVNFLRIGRVAFIYQTRDHNKMGLWDQKARAWVSLGSEYRTQIIKGLRMAKKQLAPDMLIVPVSAPEA
ncbi:MAG: DUF3450 domain-containing protein [Enterobacterales bacterium]|nr:DUF3450 domain-containing protein [Enterobacterales bacterium]